MTVETDVLREDLRAAMRSLQLGLPEYSADPIVRRRVGKMLANFDAKFLACKPYKSTDRSGQNRHPDKP